MRAIWFELNSSKIIDIRFGESQFKIRDDFWYDWLPDGSKERTTAFCPNLVPDTPKNREIVEKIKSIYKEIKDFTDAKEKEMYQVRMNLRR